MPRKVMKGQYSPREHILRLYFAFRLDFGHTGVLKEPRSWQYLTWQFSISMSALQMAACCFWNNLPLFCYERDTHCATCFEGRLTYRAYTTIFYFLCYSPKDPWHFGASWTRNSWKCNVNLFVMLPNAHTKTLIKSAWIQFNATRVCFVLFTKSDLYS